MSPSKEVIALNAELAMRAVLRGEPIDDWTRAALKDGATLLGDLSRRWTREAEMRRRVEIEGAFVSLVAEPRDTDG